MMRIKNTRDVIICGVGFQTETMVNYFRLKKVNIICILTDTFTKKPDLCYLIPSKRGSKKNSFSEVDMMMDTIINGIPVKRFDMLTDKEKNALFIFYDSIESLKIYENIKENSDIEIYQLTKNDLKKINANFWTNDKIINELWKTNQYLYSEVEILKNCMRRQLKSTVYDFHFEFHLVEHCNLKCAGCTHFSSIASAEFTDINEFRNDIKRLSELTNGRARFINLLGGEPLLHPEICAFIKCTRQHFPFTIIRVVTNGIKLVEMNDDFWKTCRENNIIIGLTQYPINIDYKKRLEVIRDAGVKVESFSGENLPRDEMWRLSMNEEASNSPLDNFIRCPRANACIFVKHGKIFNCATMGNIEHFNECFGTKFEITNDDYVNIYEYDNIDEILEKLCNPKPFCRYCNIEGRRYGIKWKKTDYDKEEWGG